jgi:CRP-like cAMP-binding protein
VYLFFSLFYFFAELAYVEERFDALLLGRFRRVRSKVAKGGTVPKLEMSLFFEPERLMKAYGRAYAACENVIEAGSKGRETFIVHRGQVGAFAPGGAPVGTIGPGEIFGEMAAFLDEGRSATIRALEDSFILVIPPEVFTVYLKTDPEANRHLVTALSARLKDANARIGADGE